MWEIWMGVKGSRNYNTFTILTHQKTDADLLKYIKKAKHGQGLDSPKVQEF
jgi:hypothetical protein